MKLAPGHDAHLAYCLNVHPGERWADQAVAIGKFAMDVKRRVAPDIPFGLGLRLGRAAARDLADPARRRDVSARLADRALYAFTVNAFPYGAFHGGPVKAGVYAPDWRAAGRLDYTVAVAEILADLLPGAGYGSISTVPGSYRQWIVTADDAAAVARNLARAALALERIGHRTGRLIALALEPEPDCFLETTDDCLRFWREHLLPQGAAALRPEGMSGDRAEECIRRHIGVCLDACHLALQFESPEDSVRALAGAGIAVPKVQLSAALRGPLTSDTLARLRAFADPVYLHQTRIRRPDGRPERWPDLTTDRLDAATPDPRAEIRSHFHVPLHFAGAGDLGSTAADLTPGLLRAALQCGCGHFEIETYTYDVLPPALRSASLAESIAREYAATLKIARRLHRADRAEM